MEKSNTKKPQKVTVIIDDGDPFTVDVSGEPFETDMTDEQAEVWIKELTESEEVDSLEAHIAGLSQMKLRNILQ